MITKEQLKERVNYLGGSDTSAILGVSRWSTPLQVFMAKVYPNRDDSENRIGGKNEPAYWGNKLEDKVAEAFTEVTGKKVYRVNETLIHPKHDFIRANIDRRVVGEDAILEVKTASAFKAKEWEEEEIPAEYILQVMHYLAVTGKDKAYFACLVGGQRFVWKEVVRDEELIKQILEAEVKFWNDFVLTKQAPMVTGSDRDTTLLNRLYPDAKIEEEMLLVADMFWLVDERVDLIADIKKAEKRVNEIDNLVKAEMKDHERAAAGKWVITWKNQSRTSVDSKLLKEKHPKIFAAFQKVSSFRKFDVREAKKKKEGKKNGDSKKD